ncbi:NAD-dependent epimerase/dehydratase family protein [Flavobacterium sp. F372]|uniref:NAD-dependent epimerase/dehydratase family protein n=1 Tax=Flavobacterium bernardetii TaxID=2813823 RepID=A0ABR7IZE0_9FLAO|nr:NAD-dependent epimerase/dehydratase family protein [Flavobacterium bernardetii]MBC5835132.1 NAD-dependent epimerase/dehydratase family protein [Flavobacterium bernardetii]NHF70752.1 NAD-dependent epimerase/dehydratase family protein [Flavobacterium bernardetii]
MILVTGGTGLVGLHLLLQLSQEKEAIRAIYRSEKKLQHVKNLFQAANQLAAFEKIDWMQADILDVPALELAFTDVTLVYHCAALVSFNPKDEDKLYQNNIVGTANVVNISLSKNVKKLAYVSSIAALGNGTEHNLIINEETERNNEAVRSDYSISKFGAEMEVWRGFQEGLDVVIVNPGVIFGNGFPKEGSSLFIQNIKDGQSFYTLGKLGIVAVEDVVKALTTLMKSTISGERFILVAEDVTYKELFDRIAEILKQVQNDKRIKKPKYLVKKWQVQVARILEFIFATLFFRNRMLSQSTINSLYNLEIHDTSKIKKAIDFEFSNMKMYLKGLIEKTK